MLHDKIKRLEQIAKEVSKDQELTSSTVQLLSIIYGKNIPDKEMKRLWVEKYNCKKKLLIDTVAEKIKACVNAPRNQLKKYD